MKIFELEVESPITINVKIKNSNQLEWKTKIIKKSVAKKHILIPLLKHDGQILSFQVPGIIIEVTAQSGSGPIIFRNCRIRSLIVGGVKYHEVISMTESTKENRRQADRVYVNEIGTVINNKMKKEMQACIKDLSATGFSYTIHEQNEPLPHLQTEIVEFTYEDSVLKEKITLTGKVVRRAKSTDGFVTFGCHMGSNQQVNRCLALRGI